MSDTRCSRHVGRQVTHIIPIRDILEPLDIAEPLHLGDLVLGLPLEGAIALLVLEDVEEAQDLVEGEVQDEAAQHGDDAAVVGGGLAAAEELGAGDLPDAVADEDPAGGDGALGAAGDVGREEAEEHHEAYGVRAL